MGHPDLAMKRVRRKGALATREESDGDQPLLEGNSSPFEDGSDSYRELPAAATTLI